MAINAIFSSHPRDKHREVRPASSVSGATRGNQIAPSYEHGEVCPASLVSVGRTMAVLSDVSPALQRSTRPC